MIRCAMCLAPNCGRFPPRAPVASGLRPQARKPKDSYWICLLPFTANDCPTKSCRGRGREAGETAAAVAELESLCREIREYHQRILPGPDDLLRGGIPADGRSELCGALSLRAEPSGPLKPSHLPRSCPPRGIRRDPALPATGRHAELLLPRRGLTRQVDIGQCGPDSNWGGGCVRSAWNWCSCRVIGNDKGVLGAQFPAQNRHSAGLAKSCAMRLSKGMGPSEFLDPTGLETAVDQKDSPMRASIWFRLVREAVKPGSLAQRVHRRTGEIHSPRIRVSIPSPAVPPYGEGLAPFRFPEARKEGPTTMNGFTESESNLYFARTGSCHVTTVAGEML